MAHKPSEEEPQSSREASDLEEAQKLLQDPDRIAPMNFPSFGRRIAEIITRALGASKAEPTGDDPDRQ
jgi:hypothetical protein